MARRVPDVQVAVSWTWTVDDPFGGDYDILDHRLISNTLTWQYGRDVARPLGEPLTPTASWECMNDDRILSPEWAGSPLYQVLRPGRPTRIQAFLAEGEFYDLQSIRYDADIDYDTDIDYDDGATPVMLHAGVLEQPEWTTALGSPTVTMTSSGHLARLARTKIRTPLYSSKRVDEAITIVLDTVEWPSALRDLALADTTLDWFWVHDETAFEVLVRLQHTEGVPSLIWEGPDGVLHFEHRNYRTNTTRSNTAQAAFVDTHAGATDVTPTLTHAGIGYRLPFSDIYNLVTCPVVRRERQAVQQVWEFGGPLVLGANETRIVTAVLSDPADGVVALGIGTDYAIGAGGLVAGPTIIESQAQTIRFTLTAGAGGCTVNGVTSDGPQIRATPVTVIWENTAENTIDTSASIAKYDPIANQPIPLELQAYPEIPFSTGEALCDAAAALYMEARPIVALRVLSADSDHLDNQLARRPSDRILVVGTPLGLEGDMHVEQIALRLIPEGVEAILTCERALNQPGAAVWDDPESVWDGVDTLWGT